MKPHNWVSLFLSLLLVGCNHNQSHLSSDVLITNVNLIDGTGVDLQSGVDVRITQDRISEIGADLTIFDRTMVIDGKNKYMIPGLIDTHVHLDAPVVFQLTDSEKAQIIEHTPKAFLYNGVTSVLNVSSEEDWIFSQRDMERKNTLLSPRIFAMGRSFTPNGGWGSRHGGSLADKDEALAKAQDYIERDTDGFKVIIEDGLGASGTMVRMSDEMMMAISKIAKEHDIPIYSHAINLDEFHSAVKISSKAIVHGLEDRVPEGDTIWQDMVENNTAFVPTQSLWESFLRHDDAAEDLNDPVLRASVPHFLLDYMQDSVFRAEESSRFLAVAQMPVYNWAKEKIPIFMDNIRDAYEAGVTLSTGTDAGGPVGYNFQGFNTPWEVKLLLEAGLTPMEAIVAATRNGAIVIGVEDQLGTIEVGKLADIILLSANPLANIENLRKIEIIIFKGIAYPRDEFAYRKP